MSNDSNRPLRIEQPVDFDGFALALEAEEELSQPYRFHLKVLTRAPLNFADLLGKEMVASLRVEPEEEQFFAGVIARIDEETGAEAGVCADLLLVPKFALLTRSVRSRVFQETTVPELLAGVLVKMRVSYQLLRSYERRPFCMQYRESDFDFASRVMEDEGIRYYFRHTSDGHEMIVTDVAEPDTRRVGMVRFDRKPEKQRRPGTVWRWEKFQEVTASELIVDDDHFQLSNQRLEGTAKVAEEIVIGEVRHRLRPPGGFNDDLTVVESRGGYARHFDAVGPNGGDHAGDLPAIFRRAKLDAEFRSVSEARKAIHISGVGNSTVVRAGAVFQLSGHAHGNGRYYPTRVAHRAQQPPPHSGESAPMFGYFNEFTCLPTSLGYRPERRTLRPAIAGTLPAVVVGPKGQSVFVDRFGRVKIRFSWDPNEKEDGNSSCWIRVAQRWAGKGYGTFFWPRVGHEVVVAFEEGDPDRPIIVGSVYNAENRPPFDLPENALVAGIKSASAGGDPKTEYNGVFFHDQTGDEHVQLHGQRETTLNREQGTHLRVGEQLVAMVGGLPGSAPDTSGASWRSHLKASGSQILPAWGKNFDFVVGDTVNSVLGFAGKNVIGANTDIFINPLSLVGQLGGLASAFGAALGKTELTLGARNALIYGPQLFVHRGESVTALGRPLTGLSLVGAGLVGAVAIGANVYCAATANDTDPKIVSGMMSFCKSAAIGVLTAVESGLVRAQGAKAAATLASEQVKLASKLAGEYLSADPQSVLIWTKHALGQAKEAERTAKRALAHAAALGGIPNGKNPPDEVKIHSDRYSLTCHQAITVDANEAINLTVAGGAHAGFISGTSRALTQFCVGETSQTWVALSDGGNIDFASATGQKTIHASHGKPNTGYWKLTDTGYAMGFGVPKAEASLFTLGADGIALKRVLPDPTGPRVEISNAGVEIAWGTNSVQIGRKGVKIKGLKVTLQSDTTIGVKAPSLVRESKGIWMTEQQIHNLTKEERIEVLNLVYNPDRLRSIVEAHVNRRRRAKPGEIEERQAKGESPESIGREEITPKPPMKGVPLDPNVKKELWVKKPLDEYEDDVAKMEQTYRNMISMGIEVSPPEKDNLYRIKIGRRLG